MINSLQDANTGNLYKKILSGKYQISKNVSAEASDLLKGILQTDPTKRFSVKEIRQHEWCTSYKLLKNPEGIIIGYNRIPVDETILDSLVKDYGFERANTLKCIEASKHNHITTCYYLLLKKHIANGGKSTADITSDDFDPLRLVPIQRH